MTIYISLLRGINVGRKNIIKMVELKKIFEEINYELMLDFNEIEMFNFEVFVAN